MVAKSSKKSSCRKLRPPVKWHGGKYYLASRIIDFFPEHNTYVEPFGGAASVLLNKPPSQVEVYNDLDSRITRLFRVLRDHGDEFQSRLSLTPYSEEEFNEALMAHASAELSLEEHANDIELARRDFVLWRQSLGGRGDAFSFTLHRNRRQMADVVSGYLSIIDEQLPLIVGRLRTVQIVSRPAIEVIRKWDSSNTLVYCDPPYVPKTRHSGSRDIYDFEMTEDDHCKLAEVLSTCKSRVLLSGYPSALYESLYKNWTRESFDMANHASGAKKKGREIECVWRNF